MAQFAFDTIEELWLRFGELDYPPILTEADIADICLLSLDSATVGCLESFMKNKGRLDARQFSILQDRAYDLELVVQKSVDTEQKLYFGVLKELCDRAIEYIEVHGGPDPVK